MKFCLALIFAFCSLAAHAQYAPQAGLAGSTAISGSSSLFVNWANQCTIYRGLMNIADSALGYASDGDSSDATGPADDYTVSLGDSGVAVLTFSHPICNGSGPDFAVFENGFPDAANDSEAFLELGFVEVSSDGVNYTRFPAHSLTQDKVQITNDSYIYANDLDNLAGSYIAMYGTPFDLEELAGTPGLDVNNITHVRVIDVIGSIDGHSTYDSSGRIVNDPYPTPYPSCGFDLDAVGVINEAGGTGVKSSGGNVAVNVFPNPATDNVTISISGGHAAGLAVTLTSVTGNVLLQQTFTGNTHTIPVDPYPPGLYFLALTDANGDRWEGKITKR